MAEAIVGSMLGKLQALAMSEARTMVAVNEDIRSLRDKLMWMQAFLRDAEPRRRFQPDELIKVWLQQTRDAVFDAEDAVDQYFLQVDLSRFPTWTRAILGFFATFTTQVQVRRDLSRRIRSINARLEGIITNKDRYKMGESAAAALGSTWRPSSSPSSLSEKSLSEKLDVVVLPLVGREDKIRDLSLELFGPTDRPIVISLIGESGVGKTKLMKHLYERHSTEGHFDTQAWVSFGPNLSASRILKLIFNRLTDGDTCPKELLKTKLKDILKKEEKHLLVIDGEVSSSEWNRIFYCLQDGNAGSRVVRISQSKPEQPPACYGHTEIEVGRFQYLQDTTKLFCQTFFMKEEEDEGAASNVNVLSGAIQAYSQEIFENTNGLPLAVVLLSGLLRTKEYPGEWKTVFEHLGLKQSKRLDKILSLCFDDLQYDLKSCFLYFAAFPVNTLIRTQNLVCVWMAEGFLRPKEGKTMEKVGEHYLKELIDRRLVNLAPMDYALPGDERVAVQSKVHAFLKLEAQEESFVEIHSGDDIPALSTARRLSLQNHRDKYAALAHPLPKLRAILSNFEKEDEEEEITETGTELDEASGKDGDGLYPTRCPSFLRRGAKANSKETIKSYVRQLLKNSRFLRLIHFSGLEIDSKLPPEIGNAVHLQYLRVTSCSMEEIPPSIGRLCSLQTLDVRDTNVKRLPAAFWSIRTLRHVLGYRLILPKRVGRLRQLHTLNTVVPDAAEGWDDKTFTKMSRLRFLHIREVSADKDKPALMKAVTTLKYLVLLTIKADAIPPEVFTGSNLPRLKVMELKGKLEPFLSMGFRFHLPNLARLSLQETMVSQEFIGKLGELQFLATLNLRSGSYQGNQLVFARGFRSLRELMVDVEVELKRIEIHKLALPVLVDLGIFGVCNDLQIEIHDKPRVVEKIKSEDEDLYKKITHVMDVQVESSNKKAIKSED